MTKAPIHLRIDKYDRMALMKAVTGYSEPKLSDTELCGTGDARAKSITQKDTLYGTEVTCEACLEKIEKSPWLKTRLPEPREPKAPKRDDSDFDGPVLKIGF